MSTDMLTTAADAIAEQLIDRSPKFTSSEVANLWSQYMNDSMAICWITHALKHAGVFAEEGMNLLIEHGWLEQPPGAADNEALANQK